MYAPHKLGCIAKLRRQRDSEGHEVSYTDTESIKEEENDEVVVRGADAYEVRLNRYGSINYGCLDELFP